MTVQASDPNSPVSKLISAAAGVIVECQDRPHTAPGHWAGALWEAGLLHLPFTREALATAVEAHELLTGATNYEGRGSMFVCVCGASATGVPDTTYMRLHADHVAESLADMLGVTR